MSLIYVKNDDHYVVIVSCHETVCKTKFWGIIDQSLFYIDLTVHYIQNFENLT